MRRFDRNLRSDSDTDIEETTPVVWVDSDWTDVTEIPDGYRAWITRADLPSLSDDAIRAAAAEFQQLLDMWVEGCPGVDENPLPKNVPFVARQIVRDLREALRALEYFRVEAPQQDDASLPYVRAVLSLHAMIFRKHAPDTPQTYTYQTALDVLREIYPDSVGFKLRLGTYKGQNTPF